MRHSADAIRAFRPVEREQEIGGRLAILRAFAQDDPAQILTALRAARRAARAGGAGGAGYDPVRHAALCRMTRTQGPIPSQSVNTKSKE